MTKLLNVVLAVCLVTLWMGVASAQEKPAQGDQGAKEASPSDKPAVHTVKAGPLHVEVKLDGVLEGARMYPIVIKPEAWSSLVVDRVLGHGQTVQKGTPILWLKTDKLDKQIEEAERSLQSAQLAVRDAEAALKRAEESFQMDMAQAEKAYRDAKEALDYFVEVDRPLQEESVKRSLQSAKWSLEYAQEELDQLEKMYEADDLTEETEEIILKRARRSVDSARFRLKSATISHDRALNHDLPEQLHQLTVALKRQELSWKQSQVTLRSGLERQREQTESARRQQRDAADRLAKLRRDRQKMVVKAPADGILFYGPCLRGVWQDASKFAEKIKPGATVMANSTLLTVVAPRPLVARVNLPEKELARVRQGRSATVVPTALPDEKLGARVAAVAAVPYSPGLFDCTISVTDDKVNKLVVPGMKCSVTVVAYHTDKTLTVPQSAVFKNDEGKDCVTIVLDGDKQEERVVQLGQKGTGVVQVVRGLREGDKVLLKKSGEAK